MLSIAGIVSDIGEQDLRITIDRMMKLMARRPDMRVDQFVSAPAALAGARPAHVGNRLARDDRTVLAAGGYLVDDDPKVVGSHIGDSQPGGLADHMLAVYRQRGIEGLFGLNGCYIAAIWETDLRRLTVVQDRLGYASNLYYWQGSKQLLFASEIKAIAWHPQFCQRMDEVGVADLFVNLCPLEDRTLFEDVRALNGAGMLVYQDGRLERSTYWKPSFYVAGVPARKMVDYQEDLAFHLRNAVRRRNAPRSCLLVTGGLDSRVIAGFYRQVYPDQPQQAVTVGLATGTDHIIGSKVAQAAGIPHQRLSLEDDYLVRFGGLSAYRAEGKMPAYAAWIYAAEPFLAELEMRFAITGLFGNFISGRHFPPRLLSSSGLAEAEAVIRSVNKTLAEELRRVMRPEVYERSSPASIDTHMDVFRSSQASHLLNRFDSVVLKSLLARAGSGVDALGDVVTVYDPFADNDLVDFALSMPPEVRAAPEFYLEFISRYLPEMARLPHGRTGYPVSTDLWISRHAGIARLDYLKRRLLKKMFPDHFSDEAMGCIPYNRAVREGSSAYVQQVLVGGEYLDDLFDMAAIQELLADQRSGKNRHLYSPITTLMTIALFRQQMRALQ